MEKIKKWASKNILYFAWIIALAGTIGSLVFSEILHYAPCSLCWYQRILLYPLVILLPIGIAKKDHQLSSYIIPFSFLGMFVAAYHYLLQAGIIPENLVPCSTGISCAEKSLEIFHFITLPLLSFFTFAAITTCMYIFKFSRHKHE